MKKFIWRKLLAAMTALWLSLALPTIAFAHPLGNFTINQYVGLNINREMILVDYIVDMAEIPAFQEIATFDANGNGQADSSESSAYHADKCDSLRPSLSLLLNNKPLTFTLAASSVAFPVGVGGLPTLRLTCGFQAAYDSTQDNLKIALVNDAYSDRIGWREIVVLSDGVSLQGAYSTSSLSRRLTKYPEDLLTSPLDQRQVKFEITSNVMQALNNTPALVQQNSASSSNRNDAFTNLILLDEITLPALLLALGISFLWGAAHALTPGHGKTIVGAYLVGSRGTMKHAVYLGLTTTITHTLGVFALGLITLFAAQYIVPEKLYPWMGLLSGIFVVGIGINLFAERFKTSGIGVWLGKLKSNRNGLQPAYSPALQSAQIKTADHKHGYLLAPLHNHSHDHDHHHNHEADNQHHHGHAEHSHLPPGSDDSPVTWRSLLALGISGGMIPCPSALVVLLGAIALNKIGFGLILVLAFSLGLAGALTAVGMMFIYAGKLFERFPSRGKIIGFLPVFSALFISLIGLGIVVKALAEIGAV